MSRVAIQVHNDQVPISTEVFAAFDAFAKAGWEVLKYVHHSELGADPSIVTVGGIANTLGQLRKLGVEPPLIDYPEALIGYMPAHLKGQLGHVRDTIRYSPSPGLFVKPVTEHKLFTGLVLRNTDDLLKIATIPDETEVWVAEAHDFSRAREWRCFFLRGRIIDIRPYTGNLDAPAPRLQLAQSMLDLWQTQPIAGSLDIATSPEWTPMLVEANDAYSLGSYGLFTHLYADMIVSRWAELTGADVSW